MTDAPVNHVLLHSRLAGLCLAGLLALIVLMPAAEAQTNPSCRAGKVYLTLDTGSMRHAEPIAEILNKYKVKATFFLANEKTPRGDFALDENWTPYWKARAAEGHAFGSHTFDHVYFRGEQRGNDGRMLAVARPQFGQAANQLLQWDTSAVCRELDRVRTRFSEMTGKNLDPIWRAPGGKAPPSVMQGARSCGYQHFYWADAGFLGDELPSDKYPNDQLLERALRRIKDGDILMAHLGIWSRKDPFAPMLAPLIEQLQARGFCFVTLREHPDYPRQ